MIKGKLKSIIGQLKKKKNLRSYVIIFRKCFECYSKCYKCVKFSAKYNHLNVYLSNT